MKLTVKQKLIGSFIIVSLIFGIASFLTFNNMKKTNESYDYLLETVSELKSITQSIQTETALQIGYYRAYMLYEDDEYRDKFNESHSKVNNLIKAGKGLATLQETKERLDSIATVNNQFQQTASPIMNLLATDKQNALEKGLKEISPLTSSLNSDVDSLNKWLQEDILDKKEKEIKADAKSSLTQVLFLSVFATLISIILGVYLSIMISKPIRLVMDQMKLIASGDLSREPLKTKSKDEVGQLVIATNEMASSMRELLKQINIVSETVSSQSEELTQSANEVKAGSEQIAVTMQELASGSETQANSSSEFSSTMAAFATKIQEANEHGEHIQESSNNVLDMTNEGSQLMESSTHQMSKIDQIVKDSVQKVKDLDSQSQEISKLVVVIKDVADQTNLLALNAAIEAARAGEHGKGFSVVADEVRKLAEQTAASVTDITGIVNNIQNGFSLVTESLQDGYKEVEKGTDQIKTTGETFTWISTSVTEMVNSIKTISVNLSDMAVNSQGMNSFVQEIAATAEESAAGVEQTSASVQQTSSSMEEVARSSSDLAKLAEELNELVHQFKL